MNIYLRKYILILISVSAVLTLAGCAGIKLTDLERDIVEETAWNLQQIDVHIQAMRLLEIDESYSERVEAIVRDYEQLTDTMPAFVLTVPLELPRRVDMSEDEKETLVKKVFPGSRKTLKDAQKLNDELAVAILDRIAGNAEFIWSIQDADILQYRRTDAFAVAHNAFISAERNYPSVPIPDVVPYPDQFLTFDARSQTLQASPLDEALPDITTTAEYLARSHKIYEKILFHYLARKGDSPLTIPDIDPSAASADAPQTDDSLGSRILSAIDDTFGEIESPSEAQELTHTVYFRRGGYGLRHLTNDEREALRTAVQQFATMVDDSAGAEDRSVTIRLTCIGYSDATPLRETSTFVQNFITSLEESGQVLPKAQAARKQALNKSFSRVRAQVVQEHVKLLLREFLGERQFTIQSEALGKGEELPEDLEAPYTDEDRRICVVILQTR